MKIFSSSIENKMLLSFLSLLVVSLIAVGIFNYWSTFQFFKGSLTEQLEMNVRLISQHQESLVDLEVSGVISELEARSFMVEYLEQYDDEGIILIDEQGDTIYEARNMAPHSFFVEKVEVERTLSWGWHIYINRYADPFSLLFVDIHKYTILLLLVVCIIATQVTIFLSHHFSKPIKFLADSLERIDINSYPEILPTQRLDEIGKLSHAFFNMTERLKKSETKIFKMQKLQRSIIESTTFGIITLTYPNEYIFINQRAREILDIDKEVSSTTGAKELGLYSRVLELLNQTWQEKKEKTYLYEIKTEVLQIAVEINTVFIKGDNSEEKGVLCNLQDVTERLKVEEGMARLDRLAFLGEMAAGVAHEIRNPLTGIKMNTQVLQKRLKGDADANKFEFMNRIIKEIDRLDKIVLDLLEFSNPNKTEKSFINASSAITEALNMLTGFIKDKKINIIRYETDGVFFEFDRGQFKQVVINLLLNAIQFSEPGQQVIIRTSAKNMNVILSVEDFGCGIEEQNIEKIFNPFYTTISKGTGLGLSVVQRLVRDNNAQIKVYSKAGAGTTFEIIKPFREGDNSEESIDY